MRFEFDPSAKNARERGLPFEAAARMFDGVRLEWEDRREDYGEIEGRIFFASFTRRGIRIISFRSAHETRCYRLREQGDED